MNPPVEVRTLETVPRVDHLVFAEPWQQPDDPQFRFELIRDAVDWHLANCAPYAHFASAAGFAIDALKEPEDVILVPQIPTLAFKQYLPIVSCPPEEIAKRCTSSGTLGRKSIVERDRGSIERLLGSVRWGVDLLGDWPDDEAAVINLGPDQDGAGELWFAYVMSLVELRYPTIHAITDGIFQPEAVLRTLDELRETYREVVLIGPPALFLELAAAARSQSRSASTHLHAITAGGWKRSSGDRVDRAEFTETLRRDLGITADHQIRDAFNQVELNSVIMECAERRKHIPPWLEVIIRNPWTMSPCGPGETGLISYLDPTATSYPCFIVGDDLGSLNLDDCPCGRTGRALVLERRVQRDEEWGCALKMDRDYALGGTAE
ncbi:MAG: hypothetical protein ACRC0L_01170 [Angustibacter sp.]